MFIPSSEDGNLKEGPVCLRVPSRRSVVSLESAGFRLSGLRLPLALPAETSLAGGFSS